MKSKLITPTILAALGRWCAEEHLTQDQIGQIAGVQRSSVHKWLAGDAKTIRAVNWARILPRLRFYLPADEVSSEELVIFPEEQKLIDKFRYMAQNAIMASDLDDQAKVKVFTIISKLPFPK